MEEQARQKPSDVLKSEKARIGNQPVRISLSKPIHEDNCVRRDGPNPNLLCKNYKVGFDKTCPSRGVIYNNNINGLSGKDRNLYFLLDPLIEIMITKGGMVYCVQETWVVDNSVVMVRGNMVFYVTG